MATLISIKVADFEGGFTSIPYYYPDSVATVAAAQAKADGIIPALDNLIRGIVVSAEVSFGLAIPSSGIRTTPIDGSRVDAGATLSYQNSAGRAWSHYIPSFNTDGLANKEVIPAYVVAYNLALVTTLGNSDDNGLDLTTYLRGKQSRRKV